MGKPGVGAVLADWMNDRGLNPTDMGKRAQISRATVYVVLDSRSKNPATMRQLAAGLAKRHETDDQGDPEIERRAARDLLTAAGYGSLIVEYPVSPDQTKNADDASPTYDRSAALSEIEMLLRKVPEASIALTDLSRGVNDWDDEDYEYVLTQLRRLAKRYGRSQVAC